MSSSAENQQHVSGEGPDTNPEPHRSVRDYASEQLHQTGEYAATKARDAAGHYVREPAKDLVTIFRDYAREKPDVAACWCFALGVFVGWKIKP